MTNPDFTAFIDGYYRRFAETLLSFDKGPRADVLEVFDRVTAAGGTLWTAGNGGSEMAAIAWSYAACLQIDLPLEMLFHDQGYKGDARWLRQTFADGKYIGLPILIWRGMTSDEGDEAFPRMTHWLCP